MQRLTDLGLRGVGIAPPAAPMTRPTQRRRAGRAAMPSAPEARDPMVQRLEGLGVKVFRCEPGPNALEGVYVLDNGGYACVGRRAVRAVRCTRKPRSEVRSEADEWALLLRDVQKAAARGMTPADITGPGAGPALARELLANLLAEV